MPCLKYICVPDRSRAMFFMSGTTRGAWEFVATSVDICLRHYTQRRLGGKKRKTQSLATKRQSKLLTGSHGNRGETDKGLPRKAAFRLQRKTLRFNLTRLSLAVSPRDNREVMQGNEQWLVGGIIKSCLPRHFNGHRYVCSVSVIEKGDQKLERRGHFQSVPEVTGRGKQRQRFPAKRERARR